MFRVHHSVLCRLFLPVIHRIAWNRTSVNFTFWAFFEVRLFGFLRSPTLWSIQKFASGRRATPCSTSLNATFVGA